jgi:hypothetical protein
MPLELDTVGCAGYDCIHGSCSDIHYCSRRSYGGESEVWMVRPS